MSDYGHADEGSPSCLEQIVQCPRSVAICRPFPRVPTPETLEGDCADWVAQQYDRGKNIFVGHQQKPEWPRVTQEMIAGAVLWRDTTKCEGGFAQIPVLAPQIGDTHWGTPDKFHWDPVRRVLTNWDYKFGHRLHDPYEHWQSVGYLTGELAMFDLLGDPSVTVRAIIVQPRDYANKVKVWETTCGHLRAYINIAAAAIEESKRADARARTGPACLDCIGRHACETLRANVASMVHFVGRQEPVELTPEAMGTELEVIQNAAKLLEARITGLEQQALSMWFAGKRVPGWYGKQSLGNRKWKGSAAAIRAEILTKHQLDIAESTEPQLLSPHQAEEFGVPESTIAAHTSRAYGAWSLKRDDGKDVRKAFPRSKIK